MKNIVQLKERLHRLLDSQLFAAFATLTEDGDPHTTLVAFTVTDDLSKVYVCTGRNTRKFAHLKKAPATSLLIHNCRNESPDITTATAVEINGKATELDGQALADARALHLYKHPQMADFVNSPNTALFEIAVTYYNIVTNFQDVTIVEIKPDA
jgi:general stress protein 26